MSQRKLAWFFKKGTKNSPERISVFVKKYTIKLSIPKKTLQKFQIPILFQIVFILRLFLSPRDDIIKPMVLENREKAHSTKIKSSIAHLSIIFLPQQGSVSSHFLVWKVVPSKGKNPSTSKYRIFKWRYINEIIDLELPKY